MTNTSRSVAEIDAEIARLAEERRQKLETTKMEDLETVRRLCRQHGFTLTQLRPYLTSKVGRKPREVVEGGKIPAKRGRKPKNPQPQV